MFLFVYVCVNLKFVLIGVFFFRKTSSPRNAIGALGAVIKLINDCTYVRTTKQHIVNVHIIRCGSSLAARLLHSLFPSLNMTSFYNTRYGNFEFLQEDNSSLNE